MKRLAANGWLLALLLCAAEAHADRLLTSGFETNNFTNTEWSTISASPAPTIQPSTVHSGTYAMQCATSAEVCTVERNLHQTFTSGSHFGRYYFNFSTLPGSGTIVLIEHASSGNVASYRVDLLGASATLRLRNSVTSTTQSGSAVLGTGTWYRIETRHLLSDTVGEMEMRLFTGDSTTATETLSITGEDTLASNVDRFKVGLGINTNTGTVAIDDIAYNSSAGTFQTSWPGPGKIALVAPAGDDTVAWTKQGGCSATTNTDCVDDVPGTPDDATAYVDNGTSGNSDRLNKDALPAEVTSDADIILVEVRARFGGSGTTGTRLCSVELWDETGSQTSGPNTNDCDTAGWNVNATNEQLVFDAGSRTKANLDDADFDIGYANRSNHSNRASAVWANVEWIEAPVAPQTMPRRAIHLE